MKKESEKKLNWFVILLLFFFVSESIYKALLYFDYGDIRISGITKFIFQLYMFFIIFKNYKKNIKELQLIFIVSTSYFIGKLLLSVPINIISSIEYLNNTLFIIIVLLFFKSLNFSDKQKRIALKYYEKIVILNSGAIIIGFVFSIRYFETYSGSRFGYDGFLLKSSYASYFYLMALFYYAQKALSLKRSDLVMFLFIIIAAILTGTKASLLSILLVFIYLGIKLKLYKNKYLIGSVVFTVLLIFLYKDFLVSLFMNTSETFAPIIRRDGIVTAIFSYRDLILSEYLIPYVKEEWGFANYLIGGMGDIMIKSGSDFIDVVYFFGIVGGVIYVYLLGKVFLPKNKTFEVKYLIFMIIIVSSLGGNFFYNSSLAIFLCGIKFYFELTSKKNIVLVYENE